MHLTNAKFASFKTAILLGASFFLFALFIGSYEFSIALKLDELETSVFFIGAFISFSWLLTTGLDLIWGVVIDKVGKWKAIFFGSILF
jgi:hypothetical protein